MRTSIQERHVAGRGRRRRSVGVAFLAGAAFTTAFALLASPSPAAAKALPTASFTIDHTISYLGARAEPFVFTVTNTGADPIVEVKVVAASDSMLPPPLGSPAPVTITGCPTPPAGWTATFTATQCRWTTTLANAVPPAQSRAFAVRADVAPGTRDRVANFTASLGGPALASPPAGIDVRIHAWEITDVMVSTTGPAPVDGACPAPRRQAPGNTTVGMVVCGINHMTTAATPSTASLAGTLVEPPAGSYTSGPVTPSTTPRVLGNWSDVALDQTTGEHTVVARVQSTATATSPPTTFDGYTTNTPPVANDDAYTMDEGSTLTVAAPGLLANDTDADGDPLQVVLWWDTLPSRGQVEASPDGSFTYFAHGNFHGTDTFTYRATDGSATSNVATGTITILPVPDEPYDLTLSAQTVAENQPAGTVVGTFSTADFDLPGDSHTYTLVSGAGFAVAGSQLTTTGPLDFEAGATRSIRVRSTDSAGLSVEKDLTITVTNVNEAPTAIALAPSSVAENVLTGVTVGTLSTTDVDADDSFTYSVVGPSPFGTLGDTLRTVGVIDFEEGATRTVRIRSVDAGGLAFEQDVTVTIVNVNESPRGIDLAPSTVAENQPVGTTVGTLTTEDFDLGETFTYNIIGPAPFTIAGDQLLTASSFDFEAGSTRTVTIRTADTAGLTHEEDLTVTITDVNEAPTDVTLLPSSVAENQPVGTTVGTLGTADPDAGGTFTYSIVGAAPFTIAGNELKTAVGFDFETLASQPVTVRTTDAGGLSFDKLLTVAVTNVNEAPVAVDDTYSVPPGGVTIAAPGVLGNDSDPDGPTTLVASVISGPAHGMLTLNPAGSFTYTPTPGYEGTTDAFLYIAADASLISAAATVTLSLNQPPVAVDDSATTAEDTLVDIDVSANDTDAETANAGLTVATGSIADVTGGTAVLRPGNRIVRFTPAADFNGSASFTYRASDGAVSSTAAATVTIAVTPVNDVPTVADVETTPLAYTEQGAAAVVSSTVVIADVDSAQLTQADVQIDGGHQAADVLAFTPQFGITGSYDPVLGLLGLTGPATPAQYQTVLRSVTFRSDSDTPGPTRSVRFVVSDGALSSNELARTIDITEVNDAPTVTTTSGTTSANQQTSTVIDAGVTVTDPDGDIGGATVRVVAGFNAAQDTLALPGQPLTGGITAIFSGDTLTLTGTTTAANYQAALRAVVYTNTSVTPTTTVRTARLQVTDAGGATSAPADKAVQPIDQPENVAPTDSGESYTTNGNTELWVDDAPDGDPRPMRTSSVNLLDNATDIDGPASALTTVSSSGASHGQVVLATDGSFVYTPDAGYTGPDSFTYRVSDGTSVSAPSTVNITVERRVWYVDNRAAAGDGRSSSPFNVLEAADVAATAANDIIFVREGTRTATGYTTDVDLLSGQALLGEGAPLYVGVDLVFDADGTDVPLIDGTVNLGSGNTVRGLKFVGSGTTPAILGGTGDNGGTLMDLQIIGERPGIELVGTTGDWKVWDVSIDITSSTGLAFRAENAGVLDFTANGTIALRGSGAGALRILNTVTTGTIDSVVTGEGSTTGVDIQNTGGNLTIDTVSVNTTDTAVRLYKADAITIGGGTVTSTGGYDGISVISSNDSSIDIPAGSLTGSSIAFHVAGGTGDITYGGSIGNVANPDGGFAVEISDHESGAIRLTGRIVSNGSVSVGGGESAPVEITGANNGITATGITALSVREQLVGPGGIRFRALSAPTANYGIFLHRTTGGPISVTGSGTAGSGGTLRTVHLEATDGAVSLDGVAVAAAGNRGIEAHNARSLTVRNSAVSGSGNGVVLTATDGQNDYVFENNSIVLSVGGFNTAFTLSNPILTAPSTRIWLLGNVVSGAQLDGVRLLARGTAEVVGLIADNMISRYCQSGLALTNMQGTATTDYTVTGNVLTDDCPDASDTVRTGFAAQSGTGSSPGTTGDDGGELCLDARGNALSNSGRGLPGDFLLQVVYEAKLFLAGLGSSNPGPFFVSQNSADGPPTGTVQDTADPPVGGIFAGTCDILGAPPAP